MCLVIFYCLLVIALEKLFVKVLWGLEWMCLFLRWAISWNTLEQIQGLRATGAQSRLCRLRCKFFRGLAPGYKIFQNRCSCFSFCSLLLFITKTVPFWSFQWIRGEAGQDLVDLDLRIEPFWASALCGEDLPRLLILSWLVPGFCLCRYATGDLSISTCVIVKCPQIINAFVSPHFGLS